MHLGQSVHNLDALTFRSLMNPPLTHTDTQQQQQSTSSHSYASPLIPHPTRRPSTSPRRTSSRKYAEKSVRPGLAKEIGSATISLRPRAVSHLSDDDDDDEDATAVEQTRNSKFGLQNDDDDRSAPWSDTISPSQSAGPSRLNSFRKPFQSPPLSTTIPIPRRTPRKTRPRAKSFQYTNNVPEGQSGPKRDFYLSHYSTDTQYSLERISNALETSGSPSKPQRVIELGLGDAFDVSFGEALRRGAEGEEMPLDKETMRVLNEVKDNLDLKGVGKQGRKGSIGMGLFKESRAAQAASSAGVGSGLGIGSGVAIGIAGGAEGKKKKGIKEEVVVEESEEEDASPREVYARSRSTTTTTVVPASMASTASASLAARDIVAPREVALAAPIPIRSLPRRPAVDDLDDGELSAAMRIVSSPLLRDETGYDALSDDSAWTSSGTSSEGSEEDSEGSDAGEAHEELEATDVDSDENEEEEERFTVPLQPFNHAVGGHSSIYKFTRRAVCKVSRQVCT